MRCKALVRHYDHQIPELINAKDAKEEPPFAAMLLRLPWLVVVVGGHQRLGGSGRRRVADDLLHLLEPGPVADGRGPRAGEPLALHLVPLLEVVDLVLALLHALAPAALALPVGHGGGDVLPVPTPQVPPVELLEPVRVRVEEAADGAVRPLLPVLAVLRRAGRDPAPTPAPATAAPAAALLPRAAATSAAVEVGAVLSPIAELLRPVPPPLGVVRRRRRRLPSLRAVVSLLLPHRSEGAHARPGPGDRGRIAEAEGLGLLLRRRRRGLRRRRRRRRLLLGDGAVTEETEVVVAGGHRIVGGGGGVRATRRAGSAPRPRRRRRQAAASLALGGEGGDDVTPAPRGRWRWRSPPRLGYGGGLGATHGAVTDRSRLRHLSARYTLGARGSSGAHGAAGKKEVDPTGRSHIRWALETMTVD